MNTDTARYCGVLMHITSLPSRYGIGDLGREAYSFADSLHKCGVPLWQILPLGPTGYGNSPYAARSTFAGNELLIDLDSLVADGYLDHADLVSYPHFQQESCEFNKVISAKLPLLHKAAENFLVKKHEQKQYRAFKAENSFWLDDYAVFMVLYEKYNDARWMLWKEKYSEATLKKFSAQAEIYRVLQYLFQKQWKALKAYVNSLGIQIIGDIPIFVGADSADTWSNISLFKTNEDGTYKAISGVPPDNFSSTGQRWGNPVYDWKKHEETGFEWWIKRIERQLELTDILRIDHFRGFDAYWEVKATEPTAEFGKWVKSPGKQFFKALADKLGPLPIIAEDLGLMTDSVNRLRTSNHLPGMKICQFGFTRLSDGSFNPYDTFLPHNYEEDFVAYTGTHDNETVKGWYYNQDEVTKDHVRQYLSVPEHEVVWGMIRAVMFSHARYAIFPMQDLLELDNSARMNMPSTCNDINWAWRMKKGAFTDYTVNRMKQLVIFSGRSGRTWQQEEAEIAINRKEEEKTSE